MNIINVGFCYSLEKNKNYWQIVLTTICQMLSKCSNDNFYNIHIICKKHLEFDKFEEIIHQTIAFKNFKIIHIEPTDDFNNYSYRHWTVGTMYRFIFVKKCASIEKIAYFDPDVFFKCDVAEFYNENIEKYHIGGSVDYNVKLNKEGHVKKCPNYWYKFDGLKNIINKDTYLCAGTLLMNLKLMREDDFFTKVLGQLANKYETCDQDILNVISKKKVLKYYGSNLDWLNHWLRTSLSCNINKFKIIHFHHPKFWSKKLFFKYFINPKMIFFIKQYNEWNKIHKKIIRKCNL